MVAATAVVVAAAIVAEVMVTISAAGIMVAAIFMPDRHTVFMPDPRTVRFPHIA
ncbi:hypothetical protein [Bradyrhizobium hereditatis]|uniref:hypothetical protein n=1 Tax=Bradyrhizobium hereditatis TaxID=2821405 RepID=UPI001CE2766F|nr:hypothetical protein [Bradyrhizobium hereditatis]